MLAFQASVYSFTSIDFVLKDNRFHHQCFVYKNRFYRATCTLMHGEQGKEVTLIDVMEGLH